MVVGVKLSYKMYSVSKAVLRSSEKDSYEPSLLSGEAEHGMGLGTLKAHARYLENSLMAHVNDI